MNNKTILTSLMTSFKDVSLDISKEDLDEFIINETLPFDENCIYKDLIGYGGVGVVHKIYSKKENKEYALKTLKHHFRKNKQFINSFESEIKNYIQIGIHPNIASPIYYSNVNGVPYFTLEYVEGMTLRKYLNNRNQNKKQKIEETRSFNNEFYFAKSICKGMRYAIEKGLFHRDLKPENILISNPGKVKIIDFGIGTEIKKQYYSNQSNHFIGMTYEYSSPEHFESEENYDEQSEIYVFGIVLYELFTKKLPFYFDNNSDYKIIEKRKNIEVPSGLPDGVDKLLKACLEINKDLRIKDFKTLEGYLDNISSIKTSPDLLSVEDEINYANFLYGLDEYEKAVPIYEKIIYKRNINEPFIIVYAYSLFRIGKAEEAHIVIKNLDTAGFSSFDKMNYKNTLSIIENYLNINKDPAQAYLKSLEEQYNPIVESSLAYTYHEKNQFTLAEKHFLHSIEMKPNDFYFYASVGYFYHENYLNEFALEYFLKALELNNKEYYLYINIANIYLQYNDYPRAENILLEGIKYAKEEEKLILHILNFYDFDYNKRKKFALDCIKNNFNSSNVFLRIKEIFKHDGDFSEIIKNINIEPGKDKFDIYNIESNIDQFIQEKKYESAESLLNKIPENTAFYHEKSADIKLAKGQKQEALKEYRIAFKIQPTNSVISKYLGLLLDLKLQDEYRELMNYCASNFRNSIRINILISEILLKNNQTQDAILILKYSVHTDKRNGIHIALLAEAYIQNNEPDKAEETFGLLDDRSKYYYLYLNRIGDKYLEKKDFIKAKNYLEKSFQLHRNYIIIGSLLKLYYYLKDDTNLSVISEITESETIDWWLNNYGNCYYNLEQYEKAIFYYKKAIQINPFEPIYKNKLGDCFYKLEQYENSIPYYGKAIELKPDDPIYQNDLGRSYSRLGRYEEAIPFAKKAIELKPDYPVYHNNLGDCYYELGRYEEAIPYYKKAIELKLDEPIFLNNLGNCYYNLNRYEEAIPYCLKAIKLNTDNSAYHNNLGNCYYDLGRYEEAIPYYEKSIELKPDESIYHNNLGRCYYGLRQYEAAIPFFQKSIELKSDNPVYHNNLGQCYYQLGRYEEAIPYYEKTIELEPDNPGYHNNLGWCYYFLRRYKEAIPFLEKVIELISNVPAYHNNLGQCYYELGRYEEAIPYYKKANELEPDKSNYINNIGRCYYGLEQYEEAIPYYEKAIELKPDNPIYKNDLGNCYYCLGQYKKAVPYYEKAIELKPDDPVYLYNLGNCYYYLEQYKEAIPYYEKAIELKPDYSYLYSLGNCYQSLTQYEKAIPYYEKVIELKSDDIYLYSLGNCYKNLEQYEKAIPYFEKATESQPYYSFYFKDLGDCFYELEQFEKAMLCYKKTIEISPSNSGYRRNLFECELAISNKKVEQKMKAPIEIKDDNDIYINGYYTALIIASKEGKFEIAKALVEKGADVNARGKYDGFTALIYASDYGHLEIVKFLIENKAFINETENEGFTALMYASSNGHLEIVKFLIEKGARVNTKDAFGTTALILASIHGHLEIVKILIEKSADINSKYLYGYTALMCAIDDGHLEIAKILIEKGADINIKDDHGKTALMHASHYKHENIIELLKNRLNQNE